MDSAGRTPQRPNLLKMCLPRDKREGKCFLTEAILSIRNITNKKTDSGKKKKKKKKKKSREVGAISVHVIKVVEQSTEEQQQQQQQTKRNVGFFLLFINIDKVFSSVSRICLG